MRLTKLQFRCKINKYDYVKNEEVVFMKMKMKTKLTLILATTFLASAFSGATLLNNTVSADEATATTVTRSLENVFEKNKAELTPKTVNGSKVTAYTISNTGSVKLKRNLALKWYTAKDSVSYAEVKFGFQDTNFESVTLSMETVSAWATEEGKKTNCIEFVKGAEDKITAYVNPVYEDGEIVSEGKVISNIATISMRLEATGNDGEFNVLLNGEVMPVAFENIGANYAEYKAKNNYPLSFSAKTENDKKTVVCIYEINGQDFTGVTNDYKVVDNALPVLVVNEKFDGFLLGTKFSFTESDGDYKIIDVLQDAGLSKTLKFYQYNPTDTEFSYSDLSTTTTFNYMAYEKSEGEWTSVYKEAGQEYVSIYFEIGDDAHKGETTETAKAKYYLSWYASEVQTLADVVKGEVDLENGSDWISLNRTEKAPTYNQIIANDTTKTNDVVDQDGFNAKIATFEKTIQQQAKEKYAGSNEELQIPSVNWLLDDNNGYRAMKFTISYYSPSSTAGSPSTITNKNFNQLEIPVASEGLYKFKIFATDAAGNPMQYYINGEKVDLTSSNVWDVEEIPSFTFEIKDLGLKVEELSASKLKETKILDMTYTLSTSAIKVVGATDLKKEYKLYKVDYSKSRFLQPATLTTVTFAKIAEKVAEKGLPADGNYHDFYLSIYAELLAQELKLTDQTEIDNVKKCFVAVGEKGDTVHNSTDVWEKYAWNKNSVSFYTAEEGEYLLLGDFWEGANTSYRAGAYKVISVESKGYSVEGEDNWFEDNIVSVILFAVAGVLLILMIILWTVKPSDERLEDVEKKAARKQAKKDTKKTNK